MISLARESADGLWSVLLAAGGSSRLGYPKQLIRDPIRPLILRALDAAYAATPERVVVVLGSQALRLRSVMARSGYDPLIVTNTQWEDGLASSLRAGANALPPHASGMLVLLTDQPDIGPNALRRLASAWRRRPYRAVGARYGDGLGVPAILPRRLHRKLRSLEGDVGAKSLLRESGSRTLGVDMPEAALDLDTESDRRRFAMARR